MLTYCVDFILLIVSGSFRVFLSTDGKYVKLGVISKGLLVLSFLLKNVHVKKLREHTTGSHHTPADACQQGTLRHI